MTNREEIFNYVKEKYSTEPAYLWAKNPKHAVLRHKESGKWYGIIMNVPKNKVGLSGEEPIELLNVKCDIALHDLLRGQEGILPAYHMNKKHWITIVLDSNFPNEEIYKLIDMSHELTKK